jgi:hypothetical protein
MAVGVNPVDGDVDVHTREMIFDDDGPLRCLGDAVVEIVLALLACGLLGLIGFGFVRAPILTAAIVVPIIVFACYGGWLLFRGERSNRIGDRVAIAAAVTAIVVGVLLTYVVSYCGCLG